MYILAKVAEQHLNLRNIPSKEVSARYVKITLIGNSMNQWASINEIDVNRKSTTTGGRWRHE
jgi:hypothetical protein